MKRFSILLLSFTTAFLFGGSSFAGSSDGLVALYSLDGNAIDSINGNDGKEQGGIVYVKGVRGKAASFNGIDGRIVIPDNSLLHFGKSSFTISFWMKTIAAKYSYIIDKDVKGTPSGVYRLRLSTRGKCIFHIQDAANCCAADSTYTSAAVNDDRWHHIVGVRDSDNLLIYVDGELSGKDKDLIVRNTDNNLPLSFGGPSLKYSKWYAGALDEIRIYNRALSDAEILQIYKK